MNLIYSLVDGEVTSREATAEELKTARDAALRKMDEKEGNWAMISCWNCNSAYKHFLEDTTDNFLFACVMGCGHWFYNGVDITEPQE